MVFLVTLSVVGAFLMMPIHSVWFARRVILGAHIPIAILAGVGLSELYVLASAAMVKPAILRLAAAAVVLFCSYTNIMSLEHSVSCLSGPISSVEDCRYVLTQAEVSALAWVEKNTPQSAVVQPLPSIHLNSDGRTCYMDMVMMEWSPALTGRMEYLGHYLETYHYKTKLASIEELDLRGSPINYVVLDCGLICPRAYKPLLTDRPPAGFVRVYSNGNVMVFRVDKA